MTLPAVFDPLVNAPKSQKIALGVMLLVFVVAGAYFLLLSPLDTRVATLRARNASLQIELTQSRVIVADIARFRREAAALEKQLNLLTERLPNERETPPLYRALSDAAQQSGLAVSLFQPRDPTIHDYWNEIPIAVTADSGFHQLGEFFGRVGTLPRIVTVQAVKLSGVNGTKSPIHAELTLATYTYRPVGSPPAPKPGSKR